MQTYANECDDGNLIDGDGCDHNCLKESNAICNTNSEKQDKCILPSYKIVFSQGMYKANVIFNFPVENPEEYMSQMKASIKLANGTVISVPITSSKVINSTALEVNLGMDNIETTTDDMLMLQLPAYLKQENGDSYLTTDTFSTPAIPNERMYDSMATKGLMYVIDIDMVHTRLR